MINVILFIPTRNGRSASSGFQLHDLLLLNCLPNPKFAHIYFEKRGTSEQGVFTSTPSLNNLRTFFFFLK